MVTQYLALEAKRLFCLYLPKQTQTCPESGGENTDLNWGGWDIKEFGVFKIASSINRLIGT